MPQWVKACGTSAQSRLSDKRGSPVARLSYPATRRGDVSGYVVNGPSKRHSRTQGPAFAMPFKGYINAGALRYDGYVGMYLANLGGDGNMEFKLIFQDGVISKARLKPVWTLPKSGRTESAERAGGASAAARL